jgi:acyl carrier protein
MRVHELKARIKIRKKSFKHDLGADSLDEIEICVEVEKEFNIKISDADFEKVKTVNDLCECIEKFL